MKQLNKYITEKQTTGSGSVQMIQSIIDQLAKEYPDCKYDKEKEQWTGKDADIWKGAGQFLFDYVNELNQKDFENIVNHFGWKKWIPDINDIHPAEISMCVSLELQK